MNIIICEGIVIDCTKVRRYAKFISWVYDLDSESHYDSDAFEDISNEEKFAIKRAYEKGELNFCLKDLYHVTLEEDRQFCLMDGEESTDEWWLAKCGVTNEIDIFDNGDILAFGVYYSTDMKLDTVLQNVGEFQEDQGEYDMITNQGRGQLSHSMKEKLANKYVVPQMDLTIVDRSQFDVAHPNFNLKEYSKIIDSLNYYYEEERKAI